MTLSGTYPVVFGVDEALRLHGLLREKVLATIVYLLEATMMRIGNEEMRAITSPSA